MDYEFQIHLAEKELAHLRETSRLDRIDDNLEKAATVLKELSIAQAVTEQKLQSLIDLLVREHRNGH